MLLSFLTREKPCLYITCLKFAMSSKIYAELAVICGKKNKDIRISILIDYLDSLGMGLEITAYPRNSTRKEVLLRV